MIYSKKKNAPDLLIQDFIQSMNDFTHNGTLKEFDSEQAMSLARHYLHQCPSADREKLAERFESILSAKFNYHNMEQRLSFNPAFENRILEKIRLWVREHSEEPVKMIGFMIQWTFQFSTRAFKSYIEPALTQTALTYSLIINPGITPLQAKHEIQNNVQNKPAVHAAKITNNDTHSIRDYTELRYVKWYDEAIMAHIGKSDNDHQTIANRSPIQGKMIQASSDQLSHQDMEAPRPIQRLRLNIERRRMDPIVEISKAKASTANAAASRPVTEIRPYTEIHSVLMANDYKFQNCVKPYRTELQSKERRLTIRFDITPSGAVSNIMIGKIINNQKIAQRLKIQLMQLRFSKVNTQFGYQTIYHTFFF